MIRIIAILIGLGFSLVVGIAFVTGAYTAATEDVEKPVEYEFQLPAHGPEGGFSFEGVLGTYDKQQLQRGYQVYREVCSACHGLRHVAFRNLSELGYDEGQVKALAAQWQVPGIDPATGEATMREGTPTDYFPSPYPNDVAAAAANGGKIPPDLSLITKARHHGSAYVYSLLTGYRDPATFAVNGKKFSEAAPDFELPPGGYFNAYYPSLVIGMAPPITAAGQVTYEDGTDATISQMSKDVAAFLTWAGEPTMIKRKQTGVPVLGFLIFFTILAFMAKKQVWADAKPAQKRTGRKD
ncbi:cytochrome c1 [Paraurantiacibacter namhicola]|uniref:Cytochrome c1 n=1 Tax=Paraurantiacibacter namhicola TaxID=645517 RepID=A0A1C7D5A8_9SPHN|nr:cytochrome c1 [Paraurantiacibacter namhicola]ANU06654.1 Cytochrome c1 precursor [Paraurantiacibacter namhicola]